MNFKLTRYRTLKAGFFYFAITFGAGFVLGIARVLWMVPRLGPRIAELLESPIMLVVIILAAGWTVRRFSLPPTVSARLGTGCIALGLLLITEFTVVLAIRGLTLKQYFASRDPISGTVYVLMLLVFCAMPFLLARR